MSAGLRIRSYIAFGARHGLGPWTCIECGKFIDPVADRRRGQGLHIHHTDSDETNNDPTNLEPCHNACHGRITRRNNPYTDEQHARRWTDERRQEMSQHMKEVWANMTVEEKRARSHAGREVIASARH